jgi:hypothetical protein
MATGPSGWTRTTTARVKSPACCLDTTEGVKLIPGIEAGRRPYQGRRLPLHQISAGANDRIRTPSASEEKSLAFALPKARVNPYLEAWKARGRPLPHTRSGSAYGYRTPSASEAKRDESREAESSRNPSLHAGDVGCSLHTQAEHGPASSHRPIDYRRLSKTPLFRAGGRQGIRTQSP